MKLRLVAIVVVCLALAPAAYYYFFRTPGTNATALPTQEQTVGQVVHQGVTADAGGVADTVAQPVTQDVVTATHSTPTKPSSVVPESDPSPNVLPESEVPVEELPQLPASVVMENVRGVFRQYRSRLGGNPVGTNYEITRVWNGENARQARFLKMEDGMRVNGKGELVDVWGTPYFFHQLSADEMEIHSAGPDRKMWTGDDLVLK